MTGTRTVIEKHIEAVNARDAAADELAVPRPSPG